MLNFVALLAGLLFGIGLIVSGMVNPAKVTGFLDLAGKWDPSLVLVMSGAVAVGILGFSWAKRKQISLLGAPMQLPSSTLIDKKMIVGSLLFGIGWGLAGICPGPAVVAFSAGAPQAFVFVLAMLAGMGLYRLIFK